ncbi:hypothetical protein GTR04_7113 [Trichophyton interdigitale]|uniref:Uncharacterized protein n=2 Tax=Trichophyton interdigitale TaxID=101480 RepID=A0A9P4YEC3_9EURO|nr:hypothetical protein GY631_4190 [Trichophyton interdigitale]KAF3893661.1 hypothetical protein GY632_4097 [Trichophyton interdigitale]KAG8205507.1 hypothetical protein GTR04_7113 [Trichophyton interdigitale]KDB22313.1 hypothetical protein H109_05791 [Trichophyton interdigitale MR816]
MAASLTDFTLQYTPMVMEANDASRRNSRNFERHSNSASSSPSSSRSSSPAPARRQKMSKAAEKKRSSSAARASYFANR